MTKARTEAFSDGVFAIAITLLILEIQVPADGLTNRHLAQALQGLWPSFLAYVASFTSILVMWINHHGLFTMVRSTPHRVQFANGFLLLMITFVPFPTALLARHLDSEAEHFAAVFYCGTYVLISAGFYLLLLALTSARALRPDVPPEALRRVKTAYATGLLAYLAITGVAWFHALTGVIACTLLVPLWAILRYGDLLDAAAEADAHPP